MSSAAELVNSPHQLIPHIEIPVPPMSKVILGREPRLIRRRLEAIEEALAEEKSADHKAALQEALREHRSGKRIPFKATRPRTRNH